MQNVLELEKLELSEYGVAPLQNTEMEDIDGGFWYIGVAALALAALNTDWDAAASDFSRGYGGN